MGNKQAKQRKLQQNKPQKKSVEEDNKDEDIDEEKESEEEENEEEQDKEETVSIETDKDKLTIFGLTREYRKLLPNITRYNIPDLVVYCILSYYSDDGEYFRICDEAKVKLEYDNRRAMTVTMSSSVYGSHLIYLNDETNKDYIYSWKFQINQCYLIAIGLVDGLCVKTSYDFTNRDNSFAYSSDGNIFIKTYNAIYYDKSVPKFEAGDVIRIILNLKDSPSTITFFHGDLEIPINRYVRKTLINEKCQSLRLAVCLYNHEYENGTRLNSQVTLIDFERISPSTHHQTESIKIDVIKPGFGPIPGKHSRVEIEYTGYIMDIHPQTQFVKNRGVFILGKKQIIAGLDQAINKTKVGSVVTVHIPSTLGYGEGGYEGGDVIVPPHTDLKYQLTVHRIVNS